MKKYLIPGLAGTSLVLAVALAYSLGTQNHVQAMMGSSNQFAYTQARQEWSNSMMANVQSNTNQTHGQMMNNQTSSHMTTSTLDASLEGTDYSVDEMESVLKILIADEYKARAEYVALEAEYGESSPWTNLIKAETNHINALSTLFETYGLEIPEDDGAQFALIPNSEEEAYQIGIEAEIANIALYEDVLKTDLPDQVEAVFTNLMNASIKHLSTFEAYASGDVTTTFNTQSMMGQGRWNRR